MNAVSTILQYFRSNGHLATYGTMSMINEALNSMSFASSTNGIAVFVNLVTSGESSDGHDRCELAVYAAKLCDFDFSGEGLLPSQEAMKEVLKKMLSCLNDGNAFRPVGSPRWQFGYDDFAENVAWVCCRFTAESRASECVNHGDCL